MAKNNGSLRALTDILPRNMTSGRHRPARVLPRVKKRRNKRASGKAASANRAQFLSLSVKGLKKGEGGPYRRTWGDPKFNKKKKGKMDYSASMLSPSSKKVKGKSCAA